MIFQQNVKCEHNFEGHFMWGLSGREILKLDVAWQVSAEDIKGWEPNLAAALATALALQPAADHSLRFFKS